MQLDKSELKSFPTKIPMKHFYHSVGRYKYPNNQKMDSKKQIDADFVIDIDADHIDLPCLKIHGKEYVCKECIEAGKVEVRKVIKMLISDFGVPIEKIELSFSGKRGFHITINENSFNSLSSNARREIVDYLSGNGIDQNTHQIFLPKQHTLNLGKIRRGYWGSKILSGLFDLIPNGKLYNFVNKFNKNLSKKLKQNEAYLIKKMSSYSNPVIAIEGISENEWKQFYLKLKDHVSCHIDNPVSVDMKRLIRVVGSIHGGSGLVANKIEIGELDSFDPLKHSVIFPNSSEIIKYSKPTLAPFYGEPTDFNKIITKTEYDLNIAIHLTAAKRFPK
jgi:DNA primase small subunit